MFIIKNTKCETDAQVKEVTLNNLSSYDISAVLNYSRPLDTSDHLVIGYVGVDGESSFEISLVEGMIEEINLACFSGHATIDLNSPWTKPESISTFTPTCRITMEDKKYDAKLFANRIDIHRNFTLTIYSNAIVVVLENMEIREVQIIDENLIMLLGLNSEVVGFTFLSKKYPSILSRTYE